MSDTTLAVPGGRCPEPHAQPCPNWCVECDHRLGSEGPAIHQGRVFKVPVVHNYPTRYPTDMTVRAWRDDVDPAEGDVGPASLERTTVYFTGEHVSDLELTSQQCQTLIAALTAITDELRTG